MKIFNKVLNILLTLFWIGCSSEQGSKAKEDTLNDDSSSVVTAETTPKKLGEMIATGELDVSNIDMSTLTERQREEVKQAIEKQKEEAIKFGKELTKIVGPKDLEKTNNNFKVPEDAPQQAKKFIEKYLPNLSKALETFFDSSGIKTLVNNNLDDTQKSNLMLDLLKIIQYAPNSNQMKYALKTVGDRSITACGKMQKFKKETPDKTPVVLDPFTGRFFSNYIFDATNNNEVMAQKGVVFKGSSASGNNMKQASEYIFNLFFEKDGEKYKVKSKNQGEGVTGGLLNNITICQ